MRKQNEYDGKNGAFATAPGALKEDDMEGNTQKNRGNKKEKREVQGGGKRGEGGGGGEEEEEEEE